MNDPAAATAALNAFLRGVERRGVVFAQWQGGDADRGDMALAATLRGFREVAGGVPFAEWPRRFWAMLLASPQLRTPAHAGDDDGVPGHVARLGSGPRAALLLRLVAGLAEADAAAVLGIARPTYRLALQRALPHRDDGSADPEAWRALSAAAQQAVRVVPASRLERIAMLRDGVRPRPRPMDAGRADREPARRRWLWPATVAIAALTAAALAATWWWPATTATDEAAARIRVDELPPALVPAARFDPATSLETHRDLDLLIAQVTGAFDDDADPAFEAWLAVTLAQEDTAPAVPAEPSDTSDADEASPEQFDAPR
ncbi:MAG TPA: hypothetical protein PK743_10085 [Luteimonas sp.]|nr:hypothetical protein [Luteimonas sp.]HRP72970.1 hypothetical protein [Luteimonas sp.]